MAFPRIKILNRLNSPLVVVTALAIWLGLPAAQLSAQETSSLDAVLAQLKSTSEASTNSTLKSLGAELAAKANLLGTSVSSNATTHSELTGALQSLLGGKSPDAVAAFQKLSAAKLTPQQMALAKQVGHVGSAYLVEKDLGSLDGSQSEVAQIVSSLRKGNVTAALPAIKKVSQNAGLTPEQKSLLTAMAEKLAPGASKAGEALGNGLKSIPGMGN